MGEGVRSRTDGDAENGRRRRSCCYVSPLAPVACCVSFLAITCFSDVDKSPHVSLLLSSSPLPPSLLLEMMSTGYSTLFSLGLSSIHTSFPLDPDAPSSSSLSLSATSSTPSSSAAVAPPKIQIDTQTLRPQHRRRRSSITNANSPLGNIGVKSTTQTARASAASPARQRHRRSESDAVQRIRSYSMGDGIR